MGSSDHSGLADTFLSVGAYLPGSSVADVECAQHGPYKALTLVIGGQKRTQGCPKCMAEHDKGVIQARVVASRHEANQARIEGLFEQAGIPSLYRHESFDTYSFSHIKEEREAQIKAVRACRSFAENFGVVLESGGNLLLAGDCGTGKTHLACSISAHLTRNGYSSLFIEAAYIVMRVMAARRFSSSISEEEVIREIADADLLVIDEIDEFNSEAERTILINVINARYRNKKPIVVITNISAPDLMEKLSVKSVDRLADKGLLIPFTWGSNRTKASNPTPPWMNHDK